MSLSSVVFQDGAALDEKLLQSKLSRLPASLKTIPTAYGDIRKVRLASNPDAPLVVLIQDAHGIASAQKSIAAILRGIHPSLVGVEGVRGAFDLARYRDLPHNKEMKEMAEFALNQSLLSGVEYFGLTEDKEPLLWGVETEASYVKNVEAYRRGAQVMPAVEKRLSRAVQSLASARAALSPELKALDKALEDQSAGEMPFTAFLDTLSEMSSIAAELRSGHRPQVAYFMDALSREKSLDFSAVEKERQSLVETLSRTLPKADLEGLMQASVAYRAGRRRHADYYGYLGELLAKAGLSLKNYPSFDGYVQYVLLTDRIDAVRLFDQFEALKDAAVARAARSADEKAYFARAGDLRLARKLTRFELSSDEWRRYQARSPFLKAGGLWEAELEPFETFYRAAEERNQAIIENLQKQMSPPSGGGSRGGVTVLIAGGFHSVGLERELENRALSYATLTPKIGEVTGHAADYLHAFAPNRTPVEKMLLGEKLFVSPQAPTAKDRMPGVNEQAPDILSNIMNGGIAAKIELKKSGQNFISVDREENDILISNTEDPDAKVRHDMAVARGEGPKLDGFAGPSRVTIMQKQSRFIVFLRALRRAVGFRFMVALSAVAGLILPAQAQMPTAKRDGVAMREDTAWASRVDPLGDLTASKAGKAWADEFAYVAPMLRWPTPLLISGEEQKRVYGFVAAYEMQVQGGAVTFRRREAPLPSDNTLTDELKRVSKNIYYGALVRAGVVKIVDERSLFHAIPVGAKARVSGGQVQSVVFKGSAVIEFSGPVSATDGLVSLVPGLKSASGRAIEVMGANGSLELLIFRDAERKVEVGRAMLSGAPHFGASSPSGRHVFFITHSKGGHHAHLLAADGASVADIPLGKGGISEVSVESFDESGVEFSYLPQGEEERYRVNLRTEEPQKGPSQGGLLRMFPLFGGVFLTLAGLANATQAAGWQAELQKTDPLALTLLTIVIGIPLWFMVIALASALKRAFVKAIDRILETPGMRALREDLVRRYGNSDGKEIFQLLKGLRGDEKEDLAAYQIDGLLSEILKKWPLDAARLKTLAAALRGYREKANLFDYENVDIDGPSTYHYTSTAKTVVELLELASTPEEFEDFLVFASSSRSRVVAIIQVLRMLREIYKWREIPQALFPWIDQFLRYYDHTRRTSDFIRDGLGVMVKALRSGQDVAMRPVEDRYQKPGPDSVIALPGNGWKPPLLEMAVQSPEFLENAEKSRIAKEIEIPSRGVRRFVPFRGSQGEETFLFESSEKAYSAPAGEAFPKVKVDYVQERGETIDIKISYGNNTERNPVLIKLPSEPFLMKKPDPDKLLGKRSSRRKAARQEAIQERAPGVDLIPMRQGWLADKVKGIDAAHAAAVRREAFWNSAVAAAVNADKKTPPPPATPEEVSKFLDDVGRVSPALMDSRYQARMVAIYVVLERMAAQVATAGVEELPGGMAGLAVLAGRLGETGLFRDVPTAARNMAEARHFDLLGRNFNQAESDAFTALLDLGNGSREAVVNQYAHHVADLRGLTEEQIVQRLGQTLLQVGDQKGLEKRLLITPLSLAQLREMVGKHAQGEARHLLTEALGRATLVSREPGQVVQLKDVLEKALGLDALSAHPIQIFGRPTDQAGNVLLDVSGLEGMSNIQFVEMILGVPLAVPVGQIGEFLKHLQVLATQA